MGRTHPMTTDPHGSSRALVEQWLSAIAVATAWRQRGLSLWTRGSEHKLVLVLERSPWVNAYYPRLGLYLDADDPRGSASSADVAFDVVLKEVVALAELDRALNFEQFSLDELQRRSIVELVVERQIIPLANTLFTREGLIGFLRETKSELEVPIWTRQRLGLA